MKIKKLQGSFGANAKTAVLVALTQQLSDQTLHQGRTVPEFIPTVFDNYTVNIPILENEAACTLSIWDTQGQKDYHRLRPLSYPGSDVFVLCFSLTDPGTLEFALQQMVPEMRNYANDAGILLVGFNPEDRDQVLLGGSEATEAIAITTRQGREAARSIDAFGYVEVSLVSEKGIRTMVDMVMEYTRRRQRGGRKGSSGSGDGFLSCCFGGARGGGSDGSTVDFVDMPGGGDQANVHSFTFPSSGLALVSDRAYLDKRLKRDIHEQYDALCGPVDPRLYHKQLQQLKVAAAKHKPLGVSHIAFHLLRRVHGIAPGTVTRAVVRDVVKPTTYSPYLQYLVGRRDVHGDPLLDFAGFFVSHAWDYNFDSLTEAVTAHAQHTHNTSRSWPYYWVDLFIKGEGGATMSSNEDNKANNT